MTSNILRVLGNLNTVLDARHDSNGSVNRNYLSYHNGLFKRFQLADRYRVGHSDVPVWTWMKGTGQFMLT